MTIVQAMLVTHDATGITISVVSYLSEVTRVIFVEKNSVVMLSTSITSASRMRSVLANTTVTGGDVSSLLSVVV